MKHLFLLFLLIPVTLFAQVDKKYLAGAVPVVDDRVVFTEELNLPGRSQNDIFHFVTMGDYPFYNHRRAAKPDTLLRSG